MVTKDLAILGPVARAAFFLGNGDERTNVAHSQAEYPGVTDEPQPTDIGGCEEAMGRSLAAIHTPLRVRDQANLLVVSDGLHGHAGRPGGFSDRVDLLCH
jgi:hypothetical protein